MSNKKPEVVNGLDESLFAGDQIHERMVELGDGKKHLLHFKEVTGGEIRRFQLAERSDDEEKRVGAIARLICASLCTPDGKPAITFTKAAKLKAKPMNAIFAAVLEVNEFGGKKDSPSAEQTGSATS